MTRPQHRDLIRPVLILFGLSAAITVALLVYAARSQNEVATEQSVRAARSLVDVRLRLLTRVLSDHARWNEDAADNLLASFNPAWATYNLGEALAKEHDLSLIAVVDGQDRVIHAWKDGAVRTGLTLAALGPGIGDLVAARRAAPGDARPLVSPLSLPGEPVHIVGVNRLVAPDAAAGPAVPGADRTILVIARRLDSRLIAELAESYGLKALTVAPADGPADPASLTLADPKGTPVGRLAWVLDLPGRRLITGVLPAIIGAKLVMAGFLAVFLSRARRTATRMAEDAARIGEQAGHIAEREAEIRAILDGVGDGILTVDARGMINTANPRAGEILRQPTESLVGQPFAALFARPEAAAAILALESTAEDERDIEAEVLRPDGSGFGAELSIGSMIRGGRTFRIVAIRDVTERRRAEQTLDLLNTALLIVDGDGRLLLANRGAERLLAEDDCLIREGGRLLAARDGATLSAAIARACGPDPAGSMIQVLRSGGRHPLTALITPTGAGGGGTGGGGSCSIFLRDPEIRWTVSAGALSNLYGLTPAEARVVAELVAGKGLQEMATEFDLSINTIRNHLKQAYRKTGTARQSELVSLILAGPAFQPETPG